MHIILHPPPKFTHSINSIGQRCELGIKRISYNHVSILPTTAAVTAPRGRRAPDPIARRSNLDLDAVGLGRGRGGNYFLFEIRRGGNWSGVAKLGRVGVVGLGRLDAGVECYSTPI